LFAGIFSKPYAATLICSRLTLMQMHVLASVPRTWQGYKITVNAINVFRYWSPNLFVFLLHSGRMPCTAQVALDPIFFTAFCGKWWRIWVPSTMLLLISHHRLQSQDHELCRSSHFDTSLKLPNVELHPKFCSVLSCHWNEIWSTLPKALVSHLHPVLIFKIFIAVHLCETLLSTNESV